MKEALVIVFSNLKHDARVLRQITWVKKRFRVTVICFDADETSEFTVLKITQTKLSLFRKLKLGIYLFFRLYNLAYRTFHDYHQLIPQLRNQQFDLIIANDVDALPLAFSIKNNSRIIFDAHEYAPRHFENNFVWRIFFQPFYIYLCKKYIPKTDGMLTVGKGLAAEYQKNFKINPVIITNASRYTQIEPSTSHNNKIRLVHHGIINPSRQLELMLEMMNDLDDRFTLDLILMTSDFASPKTKYYIEKFKSKASKNERIKILPSVKNNEVIKTINQYDIGVFLIPPVNFNYANTLPNKLFDFIQARLAVAIGPTPEMAEIVKQYKNGVVADDFNPKSLAAKLNELTEIDIRTLKNNSGKAASVLNSESNEIIFNQLIDKLTFEKGIM